jgi:hypothetical protein
MFGDPSWKRLTRPRPNLCTVQTERYLEILELLHGSPGDDKGKTKLCAVTARLLGMDGAGLALVSHGRQVLEYCSSIDVARRLMDIEMTLGEGPCLSSWARDEVVVEPDLRSAVHVELKIYAPMAVSEGVRSIFAFPVRIGATILGSLFTFSDREGPLNDVQNRDAHLLASIGARAILALQSGAPNALISGELERSATFDFVVQQAAGMIAVQGSTSVHEALVLIRAHGFASSERSTAIAHKIVAGFLIYKADSGEWIVGHGRSA